MTIRSGTLRVVRGSGLIRPLSAVMRLWYWLVKRSGRLRRISAIDAVYTPRYFRAEHDMTAPTAGVVVEVLIEHFAPRTVVDVGCGTAVYLREFERRGVDVFGLEGSSHAIAAALIDPGRIRQVDLARPLSPSGEFDLVICFEVGEHLPDSASRVLAATIASLGRRIVFSAARPGQGGVDHLNEQPGAYWIERFEHAGCRYEPELTTRLRHDLAARGSAWWLPRNALVLTRAERPASTGSRP
jgi:SAM-dependent methyltransferase